MLEKIMTLLRKPEPPVPQICEFCNQLPETPFIYCQKDACSQASLARLVSRTRKSRDRRLMKTRQRPAVRLDTQPSERCPLCREDIGKILSSSCENCRTTYHNDCLLELTNSRCSTVGCNRHVVTAEKTVLLD